MIVIPRKLGRVVPCRLILWPTETFLKELAENLPLTQYARIAFARTDLDHGRCIVSHTLSLTLLIDLQRPLKAIYKNLIENARIRIHKAEKLGSRLTLRHYSGGPDQDHLVEQFVDLYNDFAHGKPLETTPVSVADEYSYFPSADLVMAYLDNQPICGHLNLIDRETGIVRMHHSAGRRFHDPATARLAGIANVYLHWHELEKYREDGFAAYDFGSLGQVEDSVGVNRFKMQFGGTIIREHNY
ncbi:MAG: GNAT family N-acetyltransferase, partial [Acidobacteriaceae bacterium]|nr:GNAT family N-acetyltransferase [Acidobacteriaceae bacterium]